MPSLLRGTTNAALSCMPLLLVAMLAACGGDGKGPVAPNPSSPTSLKLVGPEFLKINQSASYGIEGAYADGTTRPMTPTGWGCENPNVASMSGGNLTGMSPGMAMVFGDCSHGRARLHVRVVPDYAGSWAGTYFWRSCVATGEFDRERTCEIIPIGLEMPVTFRLSQDRDQTSGTAALGDLMGDVSGSIDVPGHMALRGSMSYQVEGMLVTISLENWDSMADGDRMSGRFRQVWSMTGVTGTMTAECEFGTVVRTSPAASLVRPPAGEARTLRDLIRMLQRRL